MVGLVLAGSSSSVLYVFFHFSCLRIYTEEESKKKKEKEKPRC